MMAASFQEVTLDTGDDDDRAVLVLRDGRLTAVLTHLSAMHDELAGMWFVETLFGKRPPKPQHIFAHPDEFIAWLEAE